MSASSFASTLLSLTVTTCPVCLKICSTSRSLLLVTLHHKLGFFLIFSRTLAFFYLNTPPDSQQLPITPHFKRFQLFPVLCSFALASVQLYTPLFHPSVHSIIPSYCVVHLTSCHISSTFYFSLLWSNFCWFLSQISVLELRPFNIFPSFSSFSAKEQHHQQMLIPLFLLLACSFSDIIDFILCIYFCPL